MSEIGYNDVDRIIAEQIEEAKKNGGEYQGRESEGEREPDKEAKPKPSARAEAPGPDSAKTDGIAQVKANTVEK